MDMDTSPKNTQELIDELFFQAAASSRIETLNFLLNEFINSENFKNANPVFRSDTVFEVTQLTNFLVKLQEFHTEERPEKALKAA